ncbi:MAG: peptide-methionine (S)-S-oxide reductase MsrA [Aureispira sp.]
MRIIAIIIGIALMGVACSSPQNSETKITTTPTNTVEATTVANRSATKELKNLSKAYFASGCFWCVEAIFESVKGVEEAVSGYAGGTEANPTYQQVGAGATSHTEAVEVYYDPNVVDYETLVKVYYGSHDPTTVNGQAPDFGTQYRSMILYTNDKEKEIAMKFKKDLDASGTYSKPIATEIEPLTKFWKAEDYHQDFERLNPNQSYVRSVSIPRLNRFKKKFPELLKEEAKH